MQTTLAPTYIILCQPPDYPDGYLVRRCWAAEDGIEVDDKPWAYATTLDVARLVVPDGLTNTYRFPADGPCLMEAWA